MSITAMSYVWKYSAQKGGALLVLLAMADFANDEGFCWPSYATLAERARIDQRQARRIVRSLISAGEVVCTEKGGIKEGRNFANMYRLVHKVIGGGDILPLPGVGVKCPGGRGAQTRGVGVPRPSQSSLNHHIKKGAGAPAPFGVGPKPQTEDQLKQVLRELQSELSEIIRPAGCAYAIQPSTPEKAERAAFLQNWIQETKAEIAAHSHGNVAK